MYQHPNKTNWQERTDGNEIDVLRWHQIIDCKDITAISMQAKKVAYAIVGFACDEGVRRNKGRVGAEAAPTTLRTICSNFPVHEANKFTITDIGDCVCPDQHLEAAQAELAETIAQLLKNNYHPIVFGGGHEVAYGHFQGIKKAFPAKKIGIINFDAHFDIREPDPAIGASSGTGFWQIAHEETDFNYLVLGIQENSNTKRLFDTAHQFGVEYVLGDDFNYDNREAILLKVKEFIDKTDIVYLTICLDVFAAPFAPAVSALAYNGIIPDKVFKDVFRSILASPKLVSADIAELNPSLDIDNRTARLAASLVYEMVNF